MYNFSFFGLLERSRMFPSVAEFVFEEPTSANQFQFGHTTTCHLKGVFSMKFWRYLSVTNS